MISPAVRSRSFARRLAIPAVGLVGALGFAGTAAAGAPDDPADPADPADPGPSVLDPGSGELIELPVPYAVGQSASVEGTFATSVVVELGGLDQSFDVILGMSVDSEVTEVTDAGDAVVRSLVGEVTAVGSDPSMDLGSLEDVAGVSYDENYTADGVLVSSELVDSDALSPEQQVAAEELMASSQSVEIEYPQGEVGVGARWTADTTIDATGVSIPVTYEYELVALDAETYTIELGYDADIDAEIEGVDVSGTVSGSGTIVGDRENRLLTTLDVGQDLEMEMDGQGTMSMRIEIGMVATEPLA